MKALFLPGPSYSAKDVREIAGWVTILDLYKEGLEEVGFDVTVAETPESFMEEDLGNKEQTLGLQSMARYLNYQYPHVEVAYKADLILTGPTYGLLPMLANRRALKLVYVWNNAEPYRRAMLEPEYQRFGQRYRVPLAAERWNNISLSFPVPNHVIACSPWVKETHAPIVGPENISITFWGVDSKRFTPAPFRAEPFRVLFVGSDPIRKGLIYLIEALRAVKGAELWIAGCQVRADTSGSSVRVLGPVPNEAMPEIMRQCSVLVIPTLEDGIAMVAQEGMASGLPVIATPDAAEVFEDGVSGIKVPFRDSEAIALALNKLHEDIAFRETMGRAARALAETQTWEKTKRDFKEVVSRAWRFYQCQPYELPFESEMPWLKR